MMEVIRKKLFHGILLSVVSFFIFIGSILIIAPNNFLSHHLTVFFIPLLIYAIFKKVSSLKELFIENMWLSLWITIPVILVIAFVLAAFPMDEFDTSGFRFNDFFWFSSAFFPYFFISTYLILIIGEGIKIFIKKISRKLES